ncbi:MAG: molybdenum cofactor guanylyltransferase [Gammaproteobacteria bacterium]|nr:molybdenum cofactor guanylyltransferase [Gammaproteobacteria bacterium]
MKHQSISCLILAGGKSSRMNHHDKGLVAFKGQPLVSHVISSLKHQIDDFVISANRNFDQYRQFSPHVIPDATEQNGPMSGIAAALPTCKHDLILVVPCDMPYLPNDLVTLLLTNLNNHKMAVAETQNHLQPVFLMHRSLLSGVQHHLASGHFKLLQWIQSCSPAIISFSNADAFKNLNHASDIDQAQNASN